MNKIISIQNSGESFEKSVALFNTALHSDNPFYSNNKFCIFYGHNLPKKDKTVNPHGTIGFYEEFFSTYDWCPIKSNRDLIFFREKFLEILRENCYITCRNVSSLYDDTEKYINFIKKSL